MKNLSNPHEYCAGSYIFNSISPPVRAAVLAAAALLACGGARAQAAAPVPFVSEMRAFAFGYCPKGWARAEGQLQLVGSSTTQAYALMGATYGGNGSTTFGLPDLRGRTPLGVGVNEGITYPLGQAGGQGSVTLTIGQMPAHTHEHRATTALATHATPATGALLAQAQNAGLYVGTAPDTTLATAPSGGGQPLPTRDPYLAVTWCVALAGASPQP